MLFEKVAAGNAHVHNVPVKLGGRAPVQLEKCTLELEKSTQGGRIIIFETSTSRRNALSHAFGKSRTQVGVLSREYSASILSFIKLCAVMSLTTCISMVVSCVGMLTDVQYVRK